VPIGFVPFCGPPSFEMKEKTMRARKLFLTLAFCVIGSVICFASDPNIGTWKLNEAKSKIPAGATKNTKVVYTMEGDKYKCVVDGVDGAGKPIHNEWVGAFDGKDYSLKGDPTADARAIKMVAPNKYSLSNKKGGKETLTGTITLSADGKTRTVSSVSAEPGSKKTTVSFVYDKQ
jgi:hypothetical protein